MNRVSILAIMVAFAAAVAGAPISLQKWDLNHSTIAFRVPIMGGMSEVDGKFTDFTIDVVFDPDHLANSRVKAVIHAASIDTGISDRDKDLRSANFFNIDKYPDITFESSTIEKTPSGYVAHGDFTMHGVTRKILLPIVLTGIRRDATDNTVIAAFSTQTHLDRKDYGISWEHSVDPMFIGDDVQVQIYLLTKKNSAVPSPSTSSMSPR